MSNNTKIIETADQTSKDDHKFAKIYCFKLWEENFFQVFGGAGVLGYLKEKTSINQVLIL